MKQNDSRLSRRNFLLSMGAGGAAATAAVAATVAGRALPPAAQAVEQARSESAGGVSEHVRNYYRTARI